MNTNKSLAANDTTTSNGTAGRRTLRQRLSSLTAAVALLSIAGFFAAASPANASVASYGGVGTTSISCGLTGLYFQVNITPQTGFTLYNEPRAYRMYVKDLTAGVSTWSNWATMDPGMNTVFWVYPAPHVYQVYMQYAWQDGAGTWRTAGEWITSYGYRSIYGYQGYSLCYAY